MERQSILQQWKSRSGRVSYIHEPPEVPVNVEISNRAFWANLDSMVPTSAPYPSAPTGTPNTNELNNLSVPNDTQTPGQPTTGVNLSNGLIAHFPFGRTLRIKAVTKTTSKTGEQSSPKIDSASKIPPFPLTARKAICSGTLKT